MANAHVLRPADVIARAMRGAVSLGGGQVAAQVLNIGGAILLARVLTPAEFGLVAILTFFLALLTALGDLGLGMSLVRRPAEPSDAEYRAVSTFQQAVAVAVSLIACLVTPWVVRAYGLSEDGWWLLPLMTVAILADSVRFLPLARLERRLSFERFALVEMSQALVFNVVLLGLAWSGWRAASFPVAVATRSIVGAVLANLIGPRLSGWSWSWPTARQYLSFGLPYQGIHLLTVLRTSIVPIYVGLLIGRAAVGHLGWAGMVAGFPLTGLILLQRLYVGSFARLQGHPRELRQFVQHLLTAAHAMVAPLAVVTLILIDPIVRVVFGEKWLDAVPLFYCLWLGCLVVPTLAPLTGLLHALGQSRVAFRATLFSTLATWLVGVPLVLGFGEMGMAIASLVVHGAGVAIWSAARRAVAITVPTTVAYIWAAAAAAGLAAWSWHGVSPIGSLTALLLCGAVTCALYLACLVVTGFVLFRPAREARAADLLRWPAGMFRGAGRS